MRNDEVYRETCMEKIQKKEEKEKVETQKQKRKADKRKTGLTGRERERERERKKGNEEEFLAASETDGMIVTEQSLYRMKILGKNSNIQPVIVVLLTRLKEKEGRKVVWQTNKKKKETKTEKKKSFYRLKNR